MKKNNLIYIASIALSASFYSCSESTVKQEANKNADTTTVALVKEENLLSKNGLTLIESSNDPTFEDAILEMNIPSEGDKLQAGEVEFAFNVKNYVLGSQTSDAETKMCANSAKGQHIHLILNNKPYSAHYESQFDKELEDGNYVALAFLSRSYHMSVKQPDAYVLRQFTIGTPTEEVSAFDQAAQHLFYSRPKGEYSGENTKRVMLDFYLVNTQISKNGNKVRATINGTTFLIEKWAPYFVEGLPMGENTFKIELIDKDGNLISGPFNTEERTITLSELN